MALTATATPGYDCINLVVINLLNGFRVQLDIIRNLGISEEHLYRALHPFNRKNLFYEVCKSILF